MIILAFTPEQEEMFVNHAQLDRMLSIATILLLAMLIILSLAKAVKMWTVFGEVTELLNVVRQYSEFTEAQKTSSRRDLLDKIGKTVAENVPAPVIVTPSDLPVKLESGDTK